MADGKMSGRVTRKVEFHGHLGGVHFICIGAYFFLINYVCSSHLSLESMFSSFSFDLGDVQEMVARLLQLEQENAKVIVRSC